jgi:hypothetical protein
VAGGLEAPVGVVLDPAGGLLVAEDQGGRVIRIGPDGGRRLVASGIRRPRWLALDAAGVLYVAAHRLSPDGTEPEAILAIHPAGRLAVFADGFKRPESLLASPDGIYAAAAGLRESPPVEGAIFRIPVLPGSTAGPPQPVGPPDGIRKPVGLARDALGAFYLSTREAEGEAEDAPSHAIAKLHPDGVLTRFASGLADPQGLAFGPAGDLLVADGQAGRVIRFRAPARPVPARLPDFVAHSPLSVTGTAEPGARVDLVVGQAPAVTIIADAGGGFAGAIALAPNAENALRVTATAHGGAGLTSPPAETTVRHDDIPPALAFLAPAAEAFVRGPVAVQARASDGGSQLAGLTVGVGPAPLLGAVTPRPPTGAATVTATWDTDHVPDGSHTLTATATDRAGNATRLARVVVVDNAPPDTRITGGPPDVIQDQEATFAFVGADHLTPAPRLHFAWRLDDGPWSPFAPGPSVSVTGLADGAHRFEVKARDLAGNEDPSPARRDFTVSRIRVTITEPAGGVTLPEGLALVKGTVEADVETSVAVNGLVAAVEGSSFAVRVPVTAPGAVLTATATSPGGASVSHEVAVSVSALLPAPPLLAAAPAAGLAPLEVRFSLQGFQGTVTALDGDGDGVVDVVDPAPDATRFSYARPGLYFPVARARDAQGSEVSVVGMVHVEAADGVTARVQARWAGFKARLQAGDLPGALAHLAPALQRRFERVFQALGPDLPAIGGALEDLDVLAYDGDLAEAALVRREEDVPSLYLVYFRRDSLGRWLIEEM